ncbi:MAG TPA: plastocyanin/azurin family copper-binding protein [Thermoleophilaceae bacterium]|jgi:plastocyanin
MRRLALTVGLALAVLAGPGATALAVDQSVSANPDSTFTPAAVTIKVGESVHWHNAGGFHNVSFDDGSFKDPPAPSATAWNADRKFDAPGTFLYHCDQHGGPNGEGMSGKVIVEQEGGNPPPPGDTTAPVITGLKAKPSKFCNRKKSRKCRKPGTRIRFTLSEAASVRADASPVKGGTGAVVVFQRQADAGENVVKFAGKPGGKRLKAGKYELRLVATDQAGNQSQPTLTTFRIRK